MQRLISHRRESGEHGGHFDPVGLVTSVLSPIRLLALTSSAVLAAFLPGAGRAGEIDLASAEVFSAADRPVAMALGSDQSPISATVYEIDGIERFQASLSRDLPRDPESAKRTALTRIGQLDAEQTASVRRAALGLAKASQYRLDRYPAIVFDGRAVVYGVTSLADALEHYRQWQKVTAL
jgi:integrating conjugative element protein (TIGR03757 family)